MMKRTKKDRYFAIRGERLMNDKIQYFTKNKNGWEPVKFEDGSSIPPKGLLQYKPSPFEIETQFSVN